MSAAADLLIELGTEELPVKALPGLAQAFADGVVAGLDRRGIAHGAARVLYTPRRIAVLVEALAAAQPEQHQEVLGPYVNIALDGTGQPTRALQGFAQKNGVEWNALERSTDAKGERFVFRAVRAGEATSALLPVVLAEAVAAMPIPKPMRWGAHEHAFARPLHWLVLLLGDAVVEATLMGVRADRMSRGHRFHHPGAVWIAQPGDYVEALRGAHVLVDAGEREARIVAQVEAAAQAAGGRARIDAGILAEVTCLTEWPAAIACSFDREFLEVPQEALVSTMEANQKFFPVLDADGRLSGRFVGVANIDSRDPAQIARGYERVIRPRFADARFFFEADRKQPPEDYVGQLAAVTYQQKLGSVADKCVRVATLARTLAPAFGVEPALAARAAGLSKFDLMTRMVGEFPELQGTMGRYYAAAAGEPAALAAALDEAYLPRAAGDPIAPSPLGRVLAIAERADTLAGGFAAGLKPTGNKDPFALRRAALGLARTAIESGVDLDIDALLAQAAEQVAFAGAVPLPELRAFLLERLRSYYADSGVRGSLLEAALGARTEAALSLADLDRRLRATAAFAALADAEALAAANKRIRNILRKADAAVPVTVDEALLEDGAERSLYTALQAAEADTDAALARRDYATVLQRLAALRGVVDAYFDAVMVMAEDPALRGNRLALLSRLAARFLAVADVSELSGS